MNPLEFIVLCVASWINRHQQNVIAYLLEEVKVLKEQLGKKPRFNDDQRRRLAAKAKKIGLNLKTAVELAGKRKESRSSCVIPNRRLPRQLHSVGAEAPRLPSFLLRACLASRALVSPIDSFPGNATAIG